MFLLVVRTFDEEQPPRQAWLSSLGVVLSSPLAHENLKRIYFFSLLVSWICCCNVFVNDLE